MHELLPLIERAEGVKLGAIATSSTLPSRLLIQPCASNIGGCDDFTFETLAVLFPSNVARELRLVVPGIGSRGLGGKLPRPVTVNSPNGLAKLLPLGQV